MKNVNTLCIRPFRFPELGKQVKSSTLGRGFVNNDIWINCV